MLIACMTINSSKKREKPNSIQEETSETKTSFSDNQQLREARSVLDFKS